MIAVESLYLTALLSAFIGLIALFALSAPKITRSVPSKGFLPGLIVAAAILSVGSFLLYALSPRDQARSVYGTSIVRSVQI
jgi:ABC-type enterobactin transport system permease subunit